MQQLITPNPNIPCKPGWCLAYVNEAFAVPKRFGSATAAWNGSATKHRNPDFPAGAWVPVWFSLATEPNGHVALRAPDGSVYSTTHPTATTPTHHPDMADLIRAYARYNPLTYLGWTEDVEGTPVIELDSLSYAGGPITPLEEDDMALTTEDKLFIQEEIERRHVVTRELIQASGFSFENKVFIQEAVEARAVVTRDVIRTAVATLAAFTPGIDSGKLETALQDAVTKAVADGLASGVHVDVTVGGK